jgi:phosphatidate cytidylyltransferase
MLVGVNEIIFAWRWHPARKWHVLLIAILFFAAVSYGFYQFSKMSDESLMQLYIYLVVLTFDGFSQVCGQLLGRHALVKKISPGKTIEGALGGLAMAMCTAFLLYSFFNVTLGYLLLLTGSICAMALAGDLLASWYKRLNNVKDYSNLIPGHGGLLDRFDSFIFTGACWWAGNYLGWW